MLRSVRLLDLLLALAALPANFLVLPWLLGLLPAPMPPDAVGNIPIILLLLTPAYLWLDGAKSPSRDSGRYQRRARDAVIALAAGSIFVVLRHTPWGAGVPGLIRGAVIGLGAAIQLGFMSTPMYVSRSSTRAP